MSDDEGNSSGRKALDTNRGDDDRTMTETDTDTDNGRSTADDRRAFIDRQRGLQHVAEVDVDVPEDTWRFIVEEYYEGEGVPDPNSPEVADYLTQMVTFEFDWQVPDLDLDESED